MVNGLGGRHGRESRLLFSLPNSPCYRCHPWPRTLRRWLGMSKYRAPKLKLDAGNELSANYQDVFQVIHGINHVEKKKKKRRRRRRRRRRKDNNNNNAQLHLLIKNRRWNWRLESPKKCFILDFKIMLCSNWDVTGSSTYYILYYLSFLFYGTCFSVV